MAEKTEKSFLKGRTWYWREGHSAQVPILAEAIRAKELCLPVENPMMAAKVRQELSEHQIATKQKKIHCPFAYFQAGQLIVYIHYIQGRKLSEIEQNKFERLFQYIKQCGGKIEDLHTRSLALHKIFTKEK